MEIQSHLLPAAGAPTSPRPPEVLGTCESRANPPPPPPAPRRSLIPPPLAPSSSPLPWPLRGICACRSVPGPSPWLARASGMGPGKLRLPRGSPVGLGTSEDSGGQLRPPALPTSATRWRLVVFPATAIKALLGTPQALPPGLAPRAKSDLSGPVHISGSVRGWEVSWVGTA